MNIFLCILGIVASIGGVVTFLLSSRKHRHDKSARISKRTGWPLMITAVGIALIVFASSFVFVPTGYTGVRILCGRIAEGVVPQGFNLKIPFVERIRLVQNQQQDTAIPDEIWGETIEKTPVYAAATVITYRLLPEKSSWILANVAGGDEGIVDSTIVASALKAAMIELTADAVTNRTKIEPLTKTKLTEALAEKYGTGVIEICKVSIGNMDFEASYNAAISAKSVALRERETERAKNEVAIAKAEADKKVTLTNAEAKKQAAILAAEAEAKAKLIQAEAEAEANNLIAESLTEPVLIMKLYETWDGKLPVATSDLSSLIASMRIIDNATNTNTVNNKGGNTSDNG